MKYWIALLLLTAPPSWAQGNNEGSAVEFRVTRFDPADRPSPEFKIGPADRQIDVEVPLTSIAGPFKAPLRDGRFLDFWRGTGETPEFSTPITEAERKDLLLCFIPVDDSFKVLKIRTPLKRLRGGDRYLINASPAQIAIRAGKRKEHYIDPGKAAVVRGADHGEASAMPVLISMKDGDSWKLASTETWYSDPRFRKYLFAYLSPRTGQLIFHSVSERLER